MSNFWLMAANGTRARFFAGDGPTTTLKELDCLVNPTGGLAERDLGTDRPGRMADGNSRRAAVNEPHHRDEAFGRFAAQIAEFLHEHHAAGDFDRLAIVAGPAFLGNLRPKLSATVRDVVIEEVAKDVTTEEPSQIQSRLSRLQK